MKRVFIYIILSVSVFSLFSCAKTNQQPHVLIILTDDQAYGDLSKNGNPSLETPYLDRLANESVSFENFYVSPVCAPTRASLLTGRYHQRTGVSGVTRGRENMSLDEKTIADYLKNDGYKTACFGKWHNGAHFPYHPLGRGFDEFYGFTAGHISNYFGAQLEHNGEAVISQDYITNDFTDKSIGFMRSCVEKNEKFFCYLAYNTPHTPVQVPDQYFNKYKAKGLDDMNAGIYGMCENIDKNIGRILSEIEKLGIKENTIVVFLSDNGPLNFRYNKDLKGRKGSLDEGGVKVPFFIRYPDKIKTTEEVQKIASHIDILPTILDLTESKQVFIKELDGLSLTNIIENNIEDRYLFQEWNGHKRVRTQQYLLIDEELFDIANDPEQKKNIRKDQEEIYHKLSTAWDKWKWDVNQDEHITPIIPVGHIKYPTTRLTAHEAQLFPPFEFRKDRKHTGIAYHALYGWAHDWIDHWTSSEAYAYWEIEVLETGSYHVNLLYNCSQEDLGVKLEISTGNQSIETQINKVYVSDVQTYNDRIIRDQEAPQKEWATHHAGQIELNKGIHQLNIKSLHIPGAKSIELKEIQLIKQQ